MRRKKSKCIMLALLLVFISGSLQVSAYELYGHKLTNGVGSSGKSVQKYYIGDGARTYSGEINTAMSDWMSTDTYYGSYYSTPINYKLTLTQSESKMDIYKSEIVNSYWALTTWYEGSRSTYVNAENSDWTWGKIELDSDFGLLSYNKRKAAIAHEMGHVMGLNHASTNSLMRSDIAVCKEDITKAQKDDVLGIRSIYGGK
ncbi:matrixin family metalloprotease [Anaerocolumna xylanovorans]|uniref:Matrixin n=1 Tax=Anaerocolumna xylanovorans DSM 12503 TaxID=1121345 RepID=A0A1M7YGJ2_9FIRM|nr:matrixin family metalloprotease [Anaerocolumna xylanovorans]SHO51752.1 Matrixin [Anaerocolumna xylanovorans DSM 12503]